MIDNGIIDVILTSIRMSENHPKEGFTTWQRLIFSGQRGEKLFY